MRGAGFGVKWGYILRDTRTIMAKKYVTTADITRLPRDWEECLLMRKQSQEMKLASALDNATRGPLTEEEITANMFAVRISIAQQRLEGLEPSPEVIGDLERCARGEMTIEEVIENIRRRHDQTTKPRP